MIPIRTPTRRDFLRLSALAAAAGCTVSLPRNAFAAPAGHLIYGVQLFMVRAQAPKDLAGILKAIHEIGFTQIELFPIAYTHPAAELKQIVADSGLGAVSGHFDYKDFPAKIDYAHQLGLSYMVCPYLPHDESDSTEAFRKAAADFNQAGKAAKEAGMTFAFHNHCYEFKPLEGGVPGWQVLMDNTDPSLVKLELDLYWLAQGGQDPSAVLAKYADRTILIHLKDRTAGAPASYVTGPIADHFTELGKGTIDWPGLLVQARKQGIRYAFLDQDGTSIPVMESMSQSFAYLKNSTFEVRFATVSQTQGRRSAALFSTILEETIKSELQ